MIDWVNDLIFWYKLRQLRHEDPFIYEVKEESREYKMTSCQNCGHESHCGTPLWKEYRRAYDHGPEGQYEACKVCRCERCSNDQN